MRIGIDLEALEPVLRQVQDLQRLFNQLPIPLGIAKQLDRKVIVASIRGTDTIEGGTLSEEETEQILKNPAAAKDERERRIANLRRAYERMELYVATHPKDKPLPITEAFIRELHQDVSAGLGDDYGSGLYRDNPKGKMTKVGDAAHGGVYKPPQAYVDIKLLMETFIDWLNTLPVSTLSPPVRASLAHYYFERIHPFQDGNGRVGRILEKAILLAAGYRWVAFDLDRYYLEHLDEYFLVFNQARKQETKKPEACNQMFVGFVLAGLTETLKRLHQHVCRMVASTLYLCMMSDLFRQKRINDRQHAILEHVLQGQPLSEIELKSQGWYAALYRRLSPATKSRDWKQLREQGLIAILPNNQVRPGPVFGYSG